MSFILDALKKSEMERQRQSVPGLIDSRTLPRRNRLPIWAVAACVLLAVNLLVLTFVLTKRGTPSVAPLASPSASPNAASTPAAAPPVAASTPRADAAPPADATSATQHFSPMDAAPEFAPEIPVTDNPPPSAGPSDAPQARGAPRPVRHADPLLTDQDAKPENLESLPSMSEINLTGAQALPELHLDVHVYATTTAERFVYINMRKYHEGAKLQEGPTVERIRRDGVVLNYDGLRFLLPRQP